MMTVAGIAVTVATRIRRGAGGRHAAVRALSPRAVRRCWPCHATRSAPRRSSWSVPQKAGSGSSWRPGSGGSGWSIMKSDRSASAVLVGPRCRDRQRDRAVVESIPARRSGVYTRRRRFVCTDRDDGNDNRINQASLASALKAYAGARQQPDLIRHPEQRAAAGLSLGTRVMVPGTLGRSTWHISD
jgi:hypothetical protein